jgi:antitoxin MazE
MNTVRTQIVKIGNSRGIRIPKPLIDQSGLETDVEIAVERGRLVIRPVAHSRKGWDAKFKEMSANGDDKLFDKPISTKWDNEEWEW